MGGPKGVKKPNYPKKRKKPVRRTPKATDGVPRGKYWIDRGLDPVKKDRKVPKGKKKPGSKSKSLEDIMEEYRVDVKPKRIWEMRSKNGRDQLFSTPELLWEAAQEYFTWADNNPWSSTKSGYSGGKPNFESKPTQRPYTLYALCFYLNCNTDYFTQLRKKLKGSMDPREIEIARVIEDIEETIKNQQIEGAVVGTYNGNIISRLNSLADNVNSNVIVDERRQVADLFPKKLKAKKDEEG
jgi:hypothetical protein